MLTKTKMPRPRPRQGVLGTDSDGSDSLQVGQLITGSDDSRDEDLSSMSGASEREKVLEEKIEKSQRENARYRERIAAMEKALERTERDATSVALTIANKPVVLNPDLFRRVSDYGRKVVFRSHKFFTREEDVLDYTVAGSAGDMTLQNFNVKDQRKMQWWHAYKPAVEDGVNYSRHAGQTQIGKKLKGTCG